MDGTLQDGFMLAHAQASWHIASSFIANELLRYVLSLSFL